MEPLIGFQLVTCARLVWWWTSIGFKVTMETRHCSYLRVFWVRLTEVGRPTLNVAGPIPWAEVLDFLWFFFFFRCSVTSCLKLLSPWLLCHDGLFFWSVWQSKPFLPSLSNFCQLFCQRNFKVTSTTSFLECYCFHLHGDNKDAPCPRSLLPTWVLGGKGGVTLESSCS